MNYLDAIVALGGTDHFDNGMIVLNALPKGQLVFSNRWDMLNWVTNLAMRKHVDHFDLMDAMAFMLEEGILKSVCVFESGPLLVGLPSQFTPAEAL